MPGSMQATVLSNKSIDKAEQKAPMRKIYRNNRPQSGEIGSQLTASTASKSLILREKMSYKVFSRDFRGLAAVSAQVVH